jgi:hypothetical protein
MLLSRLLNIPQDTLISSIHSTKPNSSLEAITYATTYRKYFSKKKIYSIIEISNLDNQLMEIINQTQNETNKIIDIQSISTPLIQLGEQLTLALVKKTKN